MQDRLTCATYGEGMFGFDNRNRYTTRYTYDKNGNVTKYIYSATGQKLRAIHYTAVDNVGVDMGHVYDDIEDEYLAVDSTDYFMDGSIIFTNGNTTQSCHYGTGWIRWWR